MKRIITGGLSVRLLMPVVECFPQALTRILGGVIHDAGRSSCKFCLCSGLKLIRRDRIAHFKRHVGVCIDESGEEELPADIDDLSVSELQIFTNRKDLLAFYQYVQFLHAVAADDRTAFK